MKLYIKKTACISALEINESSGRFELSKVTPDNPDKIIYVQKPNYRELLSTNIIRRASRNVIMGLFAALKCLEDFKFDIDAVIVGNGLGGLVQSESFLLEMANENEQNLSPNPFFQSLHSSLSGNIAIAIRCSSYNMTYVNRGSSFESALIDAKMHILENNNQSILVGASDEITSNYADIVYRTNYLKGLMRIV